MRLAIGLTLSLAHSVGAAASCGANAACASLLLVGECCPTPDGVNLECCSIQEHSTASPPLPSPTAHEIAPAQSPAQSPPPESSPPPSPPGAPESPPAPGISLLNGKPLGDSKTAFFTRAGAHQQPPTSVWGGASAPLPTNRWWVNLALPDGEAEGENVVATLPYLVKAMGDGLHVCLPVKEATPAYVALPFVDTLAFSAHELAQSTGSTSHQIESHDSLSVTVAWSASGGGTMVTPLVRGMPYATAIYTHLTPQLTFATSAIVQLNGASPTSGAISSNRFEIRLATGQTWLLYADSTVELTVEGPTIRFASSYDGMLRVAVATDDVAAGLLDTYAARVPTGGQVDAVAHGDRASLTFAFNARGEGQLLMMALPHHLDVGRLSGVQRTSLRHNTLKGDMLGVVGDTWTVDEPLPVVEWGAPRPIAPSKVEDVRAALIADMEKPMLVPDPYGAGKEMAAVARLALIADELGETARAKALRKRLATKLEEWFTGGGTDPLQYEPTYGGICSSMGLADRAADFGGGWYNDHHFHYGYFLYAAAAVGRKDSAWLRQWAPSISHLIRDIANPSATDPLYPQHRFKDWFVGHSWASGIFPSASGRNQESVSEALNAWYGLALYGKALGDTGLAELGRLMLATELRSGYKYWQIFDPDHSIYPREFAANGLAAVVWSTKVDKTTWFGSNVEYAYGIQAMPVTPVTELWLKPSWLAATQSLWGPAMDTATEQWRGILLMMSAINQPDEAWRNAFLLTLFDNGNTKTNVLYWIATRGPPSCTPPDCDETADASLPPALASPPSPPLEAGNKPVHTTPPHTPADSERPSSGLPMPLVLLGACAGVLVIVVAVLIAKRFIARTSVPAPLGASAEPEDREYQRIESSEGGRS